MASSVTAAPIRLTRGAPTNELLPLDLLGHSAQHALAEFGAPAVQYGSSWGFAPLREWLAVEENTPVDRIITGNGGLNMISLLTRYLLRPGEVALVENPTYDRAATTLRNAGAEILPVPMDVEGMQLAVLAELLQTRQPRLLYMISDFQNPSGITTSAARRAAIAALARQHDLWIIEDLAYRRLRFEGETVPSLGQLAPDRTFSLGSFSKLLAPGMRTAWCITPPDVAHDLAHFLEDWYVMPNMFAQATVYSAITNAAFPPHLEHLRSTYRRRRDVLLDALDELLAPLGGRWSRPQGGFFVGLYAPPTTPPIWEACSPAELVLLDGDGFFTGQQQTNFVRVPFASLQEAEIVPAVERMANTLRSLL